jgi:hypothetical protein
MFFGLFKIAILIRKESTMSVNSFFGYVIFIPSLLIAQNSLIEKSGMSKDLKLRWKFFDQTLPQEETIIKFWSIFEGKVIYYSSAHSFSLNNQHGFESNVTTFQFVYHSDYADTLMMEKNGLRLIRARQEVNPFEMPLNFFKRRILITFSVAKIPEEFNK